MSQGLISETGAFLRGAESGEYALVDSRTGLSAVSFDALLRFEARAGGYAAEGPVERGSFASYNKVTSPVSLDVRIAREGADDELQAALRALEDLRRSADTVNCVTPVAEYAGFALEAYEFSMSARDGLGVLYARLRLTEIREASSLYLESDAVSAQDARFAGDASTVNRGRVRARAADDAETRACAAALA